MELVAIHPQDGSQQKQNNFRVLQIQRTAVSAASRLGKETAEDGFRCVLLVWELSGDDKPTETEKVIVFPKKRVAGEAVPVQINNDRYLNAMRLSDELLQLTART